MVCGFYLKKKRIRLRLLLEYERRERLFADSCPLWSPSSGGWLHLVELLLPGWHVSECLVSGSGRASPGAAGRAWHGVQRQARGDGASEEAGETAMPDTPEQQ